VDKAVVEKDGVTAAGLCLIGGAGVKVSALLYRPKVKAP